MYPYVAEKFCRMIFKIFRLVHYKVAKASYLANKAYSCYIEKFVNTEIQVLKYGIKTGVIFFRGFDAQ